MIQKYKKPVIISPVREGNKTRYVILEFPTLAVLADAQGYGFATNAKAVNYAYAHGWYPTKEQSDNASDQGNRIKIWL